MKTKNLNQAEAEIAARAAAKFSRQAHCAAQLRNGRWTWMRAGFLLQCIRAFGSMKYRRIHYFNHAGQLYGVRQGSGLGSGKGE